MPKNFNERIRRKSNKEGATERSWKVDVYEGDGGRCHGGGLRRMVLDHDAVRCSVSAAGVGEMKLTIDPFSGIENHKNNVLLGFVLLLQHVFLCLLLEFIANKILVLPSAYA